MAYINTVYYVINSHRVTGLSSPFSPPLKTLMVPSGYSCANKFDLVENFVILPALI